MADWPGSEINKDGLNHRIAIFQHGCGVERHGKCISAVAYVWWLHQDGIEGSVFCIFRLNVQVSWSEGYI